MSFSISTLCFSNATQMLQDGLNALGSGENKFDLNGLTIVDSATVAVLLAWQRAAQARTVPLQFLNAPANLLDLATLYGVSSLLPLGDHPQ